MEAYGNAVFTINGEEKTFQTKLSRPKDSTDLYIIQFGFPGVDSGEIRQELSFRSFHNLLDTQFVQPPSTRTNRLVSLLDVSPEQGHVIGSIYNVDHEDNLKEFLVLDAFDEETLEASGTFQGSYIVDTFYRIDFTLPDTVRITDGRFEVTSNR